MLYETPIEDSLKAAQAKLDAVKPSTSKQEQAYAMLGEALVELSNVDLWMHEKQLLPFRRELYADEFGKYVSQAHKKIVRLSCRNIRNAYDGCVDGKGRVPLQWLTRRVKPYVLDVAMLSSEDGQEIDYEHPFAVEEKFLSFAKAKDVCTNLAKTLAMTDVSKPVPGEDLVGTSCQLTSELVRRTGNVWGEDENGGYAVQFLFVLRGLEPWGQESVDAVDYDVQTRVNGILRLRRAGVRDTRDVSRELIEDVMDYLDCVERYTPVLLSSALSQETIESLQANVDGFDVRLRDFVSEDEASLVVSGKSEKEWKMPDIDVTFEDVLSGEKESIYEKDVVAYDDDLDSLYADAEEAEAAEEEAETDETAFNHSDLPAWEGLQEVLQRQQELQTPQITPGSN